MNRMISIEEDLLVSLLNVNNNELMDEFIGKLPKKVFNMYRDMKRHEKKQETNGASTSTMSLKRKTDHDKLVEKVNEKEVTDNTNEALDEVISLGMIEGPVEEQAKFYLSCPILQISFLMTVLVTTPFFVLTSLL